MAARIADAISALTRELAGYAVDERHQVAGRLVGIPGRGQSMIPVVEITEYSDTCARGHVNYRNITPIETRLAIEARFESEEGRKRVLSGTICDGDTLCADAEGLFVALRPGQP